jgi:DNA modification methylase
VFFYGRHLIFEIGKIFSEHAPNLTFGDMIAVVHEGRGDIFRPINTIVKWKPMLLFVKGGHKRLANSLIDNLIYSKKPDKNNHEWAQSSVEAEYYIKNLTVSEFSLVVDPFLGSGEFAIPAIEMKRYFIGIEKDKDTFEDARKYITSRTGKPITSSSLSEDVEPGKKNNFSLSRG